MPKKTKKVKVSDVKGNKPWLKKVGLVNYNETIEPRKRFLIVCEGQTEALYFKSFPVASAHIETVGLGCSKSKLVECVAPLIEKDEYEEIWCVFDMDTKPDVNGQIGDFDTAITNAYNLNYNVAYSNDAFELWFVLHFDYIDQEQHRDFFYARLSNAFGMNYEKDGKKRAFCLTTYNLLQSHPDANQERAITFSKRLHQDKSHLPFHQQNPVTLVYLLVVELNQFVRT